MKDKIKTLLATLAIGIAIAIPGKILQGDEIRANAEEYGASRRLEKLTKKFSLTKDQQTKASQLLAEKNQKMIELANNFREQFRSLLTDDQKKVWDTDHETVKAH